MTDYVLAEKSVLTSIADTIRNKNGGGSGILLSDFSSLIESGGGSANNILEMFGANEYATITLSNPGDKSGFLIEDLTDLSQIKLVIITLVDEVSAAIEVGIDNVILAFQHNSIVGLYGNINCFTTGDLLTLNKSSYLYIYNYVGGMYYLSFNGPVNILVLYNKE